MSGYSERSQELAKQLRAKAQENLERSGKTRSAVTGQFVTKRSAQSHPATTVSERDSGGSRRFKG